MVCGSINSGNNNQNLINEDIRIIDKSLKMNKIPHIPKNIYKQYFVQ